MDPSPARPQSSGPTTEASIGISAARRAEFVGISGRAVLGAITRRRSATQAVASASAASDESPTAASGCPTRAEGCGAAPR